MTPQAIRRVPGAVAANKLLECLLLSFRYEVQAKRLILVTDHPDRASSTDRAFSALIFSGVTQFVRENGDIGEFATNKSSYQACRGSKPSVVQSLRNTAQTFHCWFGPNFGGIQFEYEQVKALIRDTLAKEHNGGFTYVDAESSKPLDFYQPFDDAEIQLRIDVG
jgi:hypothetical protein